MKIVMLYESLVTSSRNKKGHFLTGFLRELYERGHEVSVFETELINGTLSTDVKGFYSSYDIRHYHNNSIELESAELIIVESRIESSIIQSISKIGTCIKLLHDVNHFLKYESESIITGFDGILADSASIKATYKKTDFKKNVWLFDEAIDSRLFYSRKPVLTGNKRDILIIANEAYKKPEFEETIYMLEKEGISTTIVGDGYDIGNNKEQLEYKGWVPYFQLPSIISSHRLSLHLPSSNENAMQLRFLEAFATGIPLISIGDDPLPYFTKNLDFIHINDCKKIVETIRLLARFTVHAQQIINNGLRTVNRFHTCLHRVNLLEEILISLGIEKGKVISDKRWNWGNSETDNDKLRYKLGS